MRDKVDWEKEFEAIIVAAKMLDWEVVVYPNAIMFVKDRQKMILTEYGKKSFVSDIFRERSWTTIEVFKKRVVEEL